MTLHLSIGSNIGDRHSQIGQAVALISAAFPGAAVRCSAPVESEPWGYASEQPYVNAAVEVDTGSEPATEALALDALRRLQKAEQAISDAPHRNADGTYRDRAIDIDIIAADRLRCSLPELQLPHPRAHLRPFVMEPLRSLDPKAAQWVETTNNASR